MLRLYASAGKSPRRGIAGSGEGETHDAEWVAPTVSAAGVGLCGDMAFGLWRRLLVEHHLRVAHPDTHSNPHSYFNPDTYSHSDSHT